MGMIECQPVEMWRLLRRSVGAGAGRLGGCVNDDMMMMMIMMMVCSVNGQCSGICGEASFQGKRLTLAKHGRTNEVYTDEVGRSLTEPIKVKLLCIGLFIEYRFLTHLCFSPLLLFPVIILL